MIRTVDEVDVRAPDLFRTHSLHSLRKDRSTDLDRTVPLNYEPRRECPILGRAKSLRNDRKEGAKPNVRYQSADQGPLRRQLNVDLAGHSFRTIGRKM
jgi:hypothetical protein